MNPNDIDGYIPKSLCLAFEVEMAEKTWQMRRYCFKMNVGEINIELGRKMRKTHVFICVIHMD
ncbi:hypothetical protein MKX03_007041 [Papaver bracteatum]|nr:hypothetical protein MKX03_007041 [Papaver bracteatum]